MSDPRNGMISCSLRDNGVPSHEDTCSFTCNPGYQLTGSNTRACQSDGNWNGSDVICSVGECKIKVYIACIVQNSNG